MTAFEPFELIRIINLPSRSDRRREMTRELGRIGLGSDSRIAFVDGVVVDDERPFRLRGEKGVFLAHLNILKDAAAASKSVLILEDDVDFTEEADRWAAPAGCDVYYGGYSASDPGELASTDIIGAHCMGFSARAVEALVPFLEQLLHHPSPPPIDGAYVWFRRQKTGFTTCFAEPVVAVQRASRSDIATLKFFDRNPISRSAAAVARRLKRKLQRGEITFGLAEAIAVSAIGILIASLAAYHFNR